MIPQEISLWRRLRRKALLRLRGPEHFWLGEAERARENPSLAELKGAGRGQRCFIMGGGPSLKRADPAHLQGEVTFGVNGIFLIEEWLGFLPTYYVVEDALVAQDRAPAISSLEGPTKIYSSLYRDLIPSHGDVRLANVLYDYTSRLELPRFSHDAARVLWVGGTVSYLCLQLAYYMEFDPVILVGFDHNYTVPKDIKKSANPNEWTSQSDDPNHFHPDYFGKGKRWHAPQTDRMELAYRRAELEFSAAGRRVLNATDGGHLEVFERVDFDSLFGAEGSLFEAEGSHFDADDSLVEADDSLPEADGSRFESEGTS